MTRRVCRRINIAVTTIALVPAGIEWLVLPALDWQQLLLVPVSVVQVTRSGTMAASQQPQVRHHQVWGVWTIAGIFAMQDILYHRFLRRIAAVTTCFTYRTQITAAGYVTAPRTSFSLLHGWTWENKEHFLNLWTLTCVSSFLSSKINILIQQWRLPTLVWSWFEKVTTFH